MNISEFYRSRFLKAADLQGKKVAAQIKSVEWEEIGEALETKPVAYFENGVRPMVLNKTNGLLLADCFGDDPTGWAGRTVELFSEPTFFKGKKIDGLKVRPAPSHDGEARVRKSSTPVAAGVEDLNDDVTF